MKTIILSGTVVIGTNYVLTVKRVIKSYEKEGNDEK